MKHSDDKKRLFQEMQQHPDRFTDEQIEAIMSELDEPVDEEAAWAAFCKRTAEATEHQVPANPKTRFRWQNIAAIVMLALGLWGVMRYVTENKVAPVAENTSKQAISNTPSASPNHLMAEKVGDATEVQEEKRAVPNEKPIALNTTAEYTGIRQEADRPIPTTPYSNMRIRGNGARMDHDKDPLFLVNGKKIPGELHFLINHDDVEDSKLWRDGEKVEYYETLYGNQARNGVWEIFLKEGKESAYADLWATNDGGEDVFACAAETFPKFPGGEDALIQFIKENTQYPTEFPDSSITGRMVIRFTVKEDGSLEEFTLKRSMLKNQDGTPCNDSTTINIFAKEAIRVCRLMPQWEPGSRWVDGHRQHVPINYFVPISFGPKNKKLRIR